MPFVTVKSFQIEAKKLIFSRNSKTSPQQSPPTFLTSHLPSKSQLQSWLKETETHEEMMLGQRTSRSFAKIMHLREETDRKLDKAFR